MCGIAFLYDPGLCAEELDLRSSNALAAIRHRGPDGTVIETGQGWRIAHARLAIIDPVGGRQPMSDPQGRYRLVFNGEIYNYRELRAELAGDWEFRTHSDSEVLLAGLLSRGAVFLERLNGMWAFALWDSRDKRLLLARDRLGKKPIFFRFAGDCFACASELPALRQLLPDLAWEEDLDSTADFLRYGHVLPGYTAFGNAFEVRPGHVLNWQPAGVPRQEPYWRLSTAIYRGSRADARREVRETLASAVALRLIADVEVGTFLSGGVDSSLVTMLAAQHSSGKLRSFSIGFSDPGYDESAYAARMAAAIGTIHETVILHEFDADVLARLIRQHIGMPFADTSILPTSAVAQLAASRLKVALSGDGGDEMFAGYQRYIARALLRWYTRLPRPLQRGAENMLRALPEPLHHHSRSLMKKAHLFARMGGQARSSGTSPYVAPRLFSDQEMAVLAPILSTRGHAPPGLPETVRGDDVLSMMATDALIYLPQDILVKVDRASMAHGLEVRCPFLDHRLVELAMSVGSRWHMGGLHGKRLLREACRALLPNWVWARRKQGFSAPAGAWFRGDLGARFEESVKSIAGPVEPGAMRQLLDEHRRGGSDHGLRLWALWSYLQWRLDLGGVSTCLPRN